MKKYILILMTVIIAVGGFVIKNMNDHDKKEQAEEVKIAQERMETFIKANYEGMHTVTFHDKTDPMGGIEVFGYYNDDTSNKFDGIYDKANNKIMGHSIDAVRKENVEIKIAIIKKTPAWRLYFCIIPSIASDIVDHFSKPRGYRRTFTCSCCMYDWLQKR